MSRRLSRGTGEVRFDDQDGTEQRDVADYMAQDGIVHPRLENVLGKELPPDSRHPYAGAVDGGK